MSVNIRKIAIMTSGGDSPGMNACLRAVVRNASHHKLITVGILRGYEGMINGDFIELNKRSVANIIHRGGTILKTARSSAFRTEEGRKTAYSQLKANGIDAIVAIGGNGTFTGAHIFGQEYKIPIIGIPGTIDNDLYGTDLTIGFDTAVNTAIEAVDKIRDTADSHDRLFFIEVMGRDSGYIALNTGIASGAGTIMLPEKNDDMEQLIKVLDRGIIQKKLFNLIIVAEGDENGGAMELARKIKEVERFQKYESKVTIIGHLQRGGSPTAIDRVIASRMGFGAIEGLMDGKAGVMTGLVNGKLKYTDFEKAITEHKALNSNLMKMAEVLAS